MMFKRNKLNVLILFLSQNLLFFCTIRTWSNGSKIITTILDFKRWKNAKSVERIKERKWKILRMNGMALLVNETRRISGSLRSYSYKYFIYDYPFHPNLGYDFFIFLHTKIWCENESIKWIDISFYDVKRRRSWMNGR
jgi:hypothetical protein